MHIAQRFHRLACAYVAAGTVGLGLAGSAGAAAWLIQSTPHLARSYSGYLGGVSCTSSTACTAVGWYETVDTEAVGPALAERWDGTRWSIQLLPASPGAAFYDVSCTSSTSCTAVGDYGVNDASAAPLAESWDGQVWSLQPIAATSTRQLVGVSCTSDTACTAVGEENGPAAAARWDGLRWSIQPLPHPDSLVAVSCTSDTACTAVGGRGNGTSAARWDGLRWSFQSTPSPSVPDSYSGVDTVLDAVSCTSSTACTAVGNYSYEEYANELGEVSGVQLTLSERWNGKRWSIQATPNPPGTTEAELLGVSCTSSTACIAVGDYYDARPGRRLSLAERWDGKRWSIQPTPNHRGSEDTELHAVSCKPDAACIAVGHYLDGFTNVPLVERLTPTTSAGAKLTGMPATCARAPVSAYITGVGIASVSWSVDGRRISGRAVRRGTIYAASVLVTPGTHRLIVRVTFVPSSRAAPRTFRKTINGCPRNNQTAGLG